MSKMYKMTKMTFLNETNETLKEFIDICIETTNDKDFISVKKIRDLYNRWLMKNGYNITTSVIKDFRNRLSEYLPDYKARYKYYDNGNRKEIRNVFTNIKFIH